MGHSFEQIDDVDAWEEIARDPAERVVRTARMPEDVAVVALNLAKEFGLTVHRVMNNGDETVTVGVGNLTGDPEKTQAFDDKLMKVWQRWRETGSVEEAKEETPQ